MTPAEKARIIVQDIRDALTRGVRHYNHAGERLLTIEAVLKTLIDEHEVRLEFPEAGDHHVH